MKAYEYDDMVTCYFVISTDPDPSIGKTYIRGYTDDKKLVQFYMEFHNCPKYKLKEATKTYREILKMRNDYPNDEISIHNLDTRDPEKPGKVKIVSLPLTTTEADHLKEVSSSHGTSLYNISLINDYLSLFKGKYQKALNLFGMHDLVRAEVYNQKTEFTQNVKMDEVQLLIKYYHTEFS